MINSSFILLNTAPDQNPIGMFIPMILFLERAQIRFIDIKLILELKWQDDFRNLKFQSLHKQSLQDYLWRSLF